MYVCMFWYVPVWMYVLYYFPACANLYADNVSQGSEESFQLSEEETALTTNTAHKDPVTCSKSGTKDCCSVCHRSKLILVLCRGSLLVVGIAIVVAAGISSQYHPSAAMTHGNYSECTEIETSNNSFSETWSATYYISLNRTPVPSPTPTTRTATSLHWTDSYSSSTHIPPSHMSTITMKFAISSTNISPSPTPFIQRSMNGHSWTFCHNKICITIMFACQSSQSFRHLLLHSAHKYDESLTTKRITVNRPPCPPTLPLGWGQGNPSTSEMKEEGDTSNLSAGNNHPPRWRRVTPVTFQLAITTHPAVSLSYSYTTTSLRATVSFSSF